MAQSLERQPLVRKVLLTGAGGQLGQDIVIASEKHSAIELVALDRDGLDVTDRSATLDTITHIRPDVIIHAGAYTAVDACEQDSEGAFAVNATGTENVVDGARVVDARVIYVSTDYVFDGTKLEPYVESDSPNPTSVYGASKLAGERAVGSLDDKGLIVRTSWVCGVHGSNMVKTILRAAENHPTLTFVDDQIGKPTFTADLAETLLMLAARDDSGIMHVTNEGAVSWFEFCQDVLEAAGLGRDRVLPCATHELQPPRPAPRPANSVLANTRFADLDLSPLPPYQDSLKDVVLDLTS